MPADRVAMNDPACWLAAAAVLLLIAVGSSTAGLQPKRHRSEQRCGGRSVTEQQYGEGVLVGGVRAAVLRDVAARTLTSVAVATLLSAQEVHRRW